ncbi:MAG: FAD-linked oxidase C-terminal domain-containing protein [Bosea sp. (in: a-proteobacteria)]|uniref:FAD-binding oxidoreductase n=1 Tax=Bosea sp. (in: a-proteobacteria) TaxID=1871050 RepID=UPI002733B416|nr:FAD-linked oxidase C-terminal domain-containing protein [Bosea sp. (in: a-proteobacteria)]MDP3255837.1 FAD-linked oxidase C-terminal domain-containing protein [Bosea sp. (in: a-proteobacteria)]MDP3321569.1 FAD-linked oxidase C-terminal domain-containing protein [Bosea sp. (in: a-proteobacteria)]
MSFPATALHETSATAATLPPSPDAIAAVTQALAASFGNRLVTSLAVRQQHGHTLTWIPNQPPDAVVYAQDTQEVSEIVTLCARHGVPVIAFGTGTSLEGHVNAPYGGVCIDLSQMKRIVAVHAEDLDCVVEAGVTRKELNEHLRDMGLMFPIDPGADASIGGMAATRASGTNAVRYGTMKDNVLALTAVMADGSIVKTSTRARKTSAGYDLTRLLVGSEGTLGIITEITLKLHGIPEAIAAGVCPFPSIKAACDTAIMTIQTGIPVARIELLDEVMIKGFNLHSKLGLPETPMLFVEFHGTEAWVKEQSERFGEIATEFGGGPFDWATKAEDRTRLWEARHNGYWAGRALRPGADTLATDVCVPISQLADCVEETKRDIEATGLIAPIAGHVGDGNFHTQPLLDLADPDEVARVQGFLDRLVKRALAMGGTCTGEHGVGQKKIKYLEGEHGAPALEVMRTLKRALDPRNILNPGKIVVV